MRALAETPLKRRLLPSYTGPCSVGVVTHPAQPGDLAVEVRLPAGSAVEVAPCLEVDGPASYGTRPARFTNRYEHLPLAEVRLFATPPGTRSCRGFFLETLWTYSEMQTLVRAAAFEITERDPDVHTVGLGTRRGQPVLRAVRRASLRAQRTSLPKR